MGVVTPRESGTYFVVAREERNDTGTYTLSLADYDDDRDDDPQCAINALLGPSETGPRAVAASGCRRASRKRFGERAAARTAGCMT